MNFEAFEEIAKAGWPVVALYVAWLFAKNKGCIYIGFGGNKKDR